MTDAKHIPEHAPGVRHPQVHRPKRRDGALTVHELDGEALVYDAASSDTHRLNSTAYFIWRQCDGAHEVDAIGEKVCAIYDIDPASAMGHVHRILDEFHRNGLLA